MRRLWCVNPTQNLPKTRRTDVKKSRHRMKPRPTDLRHETNRQMIARLMLIGWRAERIAKRLHVTSRTVRYAIATPQFQELYEGLQRERLAKLDRRINNLLPKAIKVLHRHLHDRDPWVRDEAVKTVRKMHQRLIEKIDVSATLTG